MHINFEGFVDSLPIMGTGMLGIFIVTSVIVLSVEFLNTLGIFGAKRKRKKDDSKE